MNFFVGFIRKLKDDDGMSKSKRYLALKNIITPKNLSLLINQSIFELRWEKR